MTSRQLSRDAGPIQAGRECVVISRATNPRALLLAVASLNT
jgi:hypothetical protein